MAKRKFVDAPTEARCQWSRKLRDGTFAQCGRRHIDGELCAQHAKIAAANPDLTDPVVKKAAQLVVDSFSAEDVAREDLRDGLFDVSQMQPGDIFRAMVRFMRSTAPPAQAVEMSPDFTDTARAAIAWVLWHHQGGSSPVGQPLRFALGMGQHDRMTDHQIAEAKRFAEWAGATTEGFHHHKRAQGVDLAPRSMDTAPRDGTMVRLLVKFEENATEDTAEPAWTIGASNDDNVGEDERIGWQFAGWCWTHDHFTEGKGTPVGWLPLAGSAQAVDLGQFQRLTASWLDQAERVNSASPLKAVAMWACAKELRDLLALIDSKAVGNG